MQRDTAARAGEKLGVGGQALPGSQQGALAIDAHRPSLSGNRCHDDAKLRAQSFLHLPICQLVARHGKWGGPAAITKAVHHAMLGSSLACIKRWLKRRKYSSHCCQFRGTAQAARSSVASTGSPRCTSARRDRRAANEGRDDAAGTMGGAARQARRIRGRRGVIPSRRGEGSLWGLSRRLAWHRPLDAEGAFQPDASGWHDALLDRRRAASRPTPHGRSAVRRSSQRERDQALVGGLTQPGRGAQPLKADAPRRERGAEKQPARAGPGARRRTHAARPRRAAAQGRRIMAAERRGKKPCAKRDQALVGGLMQPGRNAKSHPGPAVAQKRAEASLEPAMTLWRLPASFRLPRCVDHYQAVTAGLTWRPQVRHGAASASQRLAGLTDGNA